MNRPTSSHVGIPLFDDVEVLDFAGPDEAFGGPLRLPRP